MCTLIKILAVLVITASASPQLFEAVTNSVKPPLYAHKITLGKTINQNSLTVYTLTKINLSNYQQLYNKNVILLSSYMYAGQAYSAQYLYNLYVNIIDNYHSLNLDIFLQRGAILFFPYVNIDGYYKVNTNQQKKLSNKKNSNPNNYGCLELDYRGVDINRNFATQFGTLNDSSDPCGQHYRGEYNFSEPETKVFKYIFQMFKVIVAIDIQENGNTWIHPSTSKTNHKYSHVYQQIITHFQLRDKNIKSYIQHEGKAADGMYIDWAHQQNALALVYKLGSDIIDDWTIQKQIQNSLQDFHYIISKAIPSFTANIRWGELVLQSTSLSSFVMEIAYEGNKYLSVLNPYEQDKMSLVGEDYYIYVKLQDTDKPIILFKSKFTFIIVGIVSFWILSIFALLNAILNERKVKKSRGKKRVLSKWYEQTKSQVSLQKNEVMML